MSLNRPNPFLYAWAEKSDLKTDIPNSGADTDNGHADLQTGFPKKTMISVEKGGVPPWGQEFNGILNRLSSANQWTQAGGSPIYDAELAKAIGGYPKGAIVQNKVDKNVWVAWICLQEGNMVDPATLDVSKSAEQGGWRRYPVIEAVDGATLIYNDAGELKVYNATNTSQKYVSWSKGNDTTGKGTRSKPYRTIDKAIQSSPNSGNIEIYILDYDTHYIINYDNFNIDNLDALPGNIYTDNDGIKTQPTPLLSDQISGGTRSIIILPYNDKNDSSSNTEAQNEFLDSWNTLRNKVGDIVGDYLYAYSLSDDVLSTLGLTRPKVVLLWYYGNNYNGTNWTTSQIIPCKISGVANNYSYNFYGTEIIINNIDELKNSNLPIVVSWFPNGSNFTFSGTKWNDLNIGENKHIFGGFPDSSSNLNFSKINFFSNDINKTGPLIVNNIADLKFYIDPREDYSFVTEKTGYTMLSNNQLMFFQRQSVYSLEALKTIQTPAKRYAYINTSFEIRSGK